MLTKAKGCCRKGNRGWFKRLLVVFSFFLVACGDRNSDKGHPPPVNQTAMVAGPGEMTLAKKYNLDITLPMPEHDFLQMLRHLNLPFRECRQQGTEVGLPPPRHPSSIDLSKARTCYDIDGDRDGKGRAEAWRAFADNNNQIFYIESTYAYPGL